MPYQSQSKVENEQGSDDYFDRLSAWGCYDLAQTNSLFMPPQIISYELDWNTANNMGSIRILVAGAAGPIVLPIATPEEWIAITLILSKAPAYFVPPGIVSNGPRQVGT